MGWLDFWRAPVRPGPGAAHRDLRVALVADELTRSCLRRECRVIDLDPAGFERTLAHERPDLVFVESAWSGHRDAWKYRIASYPDHPQRSNADLARLVACARGLGIPALFWNKEDAVHFERFIASARLFDHVFTVDENCVPRYRAAIDPAVQVAPLMFAVAPALHAPPATTDGRAGACFVGSYSRHIHDRRRERQDLLLDASAARLGLTIYDRNSDRKSAHYRYPAGPGVQLRAKVAHDRTCAVYQRHLVSLNVNTIEDSATMFSRRLIEIIASGGLAVSTPSLSIERLFKDYCHVVADAGQAGALFERLARHGYDARDREMMRAGAEHVLATHTYAQRLDTVLAALGRHVG